MVGPGELAAREDAQWTEGHRAGWNEALAWFITILNAELAASDAYADTRPLESLRRQVEDRMRGHGNPG